MEMMASKSKYSTRYVFPSVAVVAYFATTDFRINSCSLKILRKCLEITDLRYCGPSAELGASFGVHTIAYGNDDIEIIKSNRLVGIGNVHFLHIAFFFQFA